MPDSIRVAVVADSHFDVSSRWEETLRIHDFIAEDIKKRGVQLLLHAGDVFERKSNPLERIAVASWLTKVAEFCPIVIVRGNHDVVGDLEIFGRLHTFCPVTVIEGASVQTIGTFAGPVQVACLAWPRKAELLAHVGIAGGEEVNNVAGDMLRNVLRGLGSQMQSLDGPKILLMHAMVRGSRVSSGQPLVGCDMEEGIEDLGLANADFYALGHIHCGQNWSFNGAPIVYPGSPRRTAYGELEEKGYLVVDFELTGQYEGASMEDAEIVPRWRAKWERVPTPCAPMLLFDLEWRQGMFLVDGKHQFHEEMVTKTPGHDAEIRFRYHVSPDERTQAKTAAEEIKDEIWETSCVADFKIEEVVESTRRARAPELAQTATLQDKLDILWKMKKDVPDIDRRARLMTCLETLEMEDRNAAA